MLKKEQLIDFTKLGFTRLGEWAPKDTADIASSRIGVGFETLDRFMFNPEKVYPHLAKLGAKWARVQTGWSRCETQLGVYDFAWLDEVVDKLLAAGVNTLFSVTYGNQLYMKSAGHVSAVGCVPLYYGDEVREAWLRYTEALTAHFKDRVKFWEIWNEPNIAPFWHPNEPSGKDYAELVKITGSVVRKAVPEAKIIGVSTCGLSPRFMEEALRAGLADSIDICAFHPYQPVPEDNLQNMHDGMRRLLDLHSNGRHIPIWQGENGCPSQLDSHEVFHLYNMDEIVHAKWVARRVLIDLKIDFGRSFYFHIADLMDVPYRLSDGKPGKPLMMGLLRGKTYEPKVGFDVFRRICSLFDDHSQRAELFYNFFHVNAEKPLNSGLMAAPVGATFIRNQSPMLAYWLSEDPQQRSAAGEIEIAFWWDMNLKLEKPVLLDLMTGQYYDVADLAKPFKGGLRFHLPLADYPLVLTDKSVLAG
jgi:hypothetical protein